MLFSKQHIWVEEEEGIAKIGITEYAQEKLTSILFLDLPGIGDEVTVGEAFGDAESTKTVVDLYSPVSGKVIAVNEEIIDEPDTINDSPYDSWLIKISISDKPDDLMSEVEYNEYVKAL